MQSWERKVVAALVGTLLFVLPSASASATELPEQITENMTLTAAGSPYTGTPTIASGVTVKVEPGTHLTVDSMSVNGTLLAEGTVEAPVRFTGAKEKAGGEWRSIFLKSGSGSSVLSHVEVANGGGRDAGYFNCNNGAITVEGSAPTIVSSIIRDSCGPGVSVPGGGAPTIANNDFINAGAAIIYTAFSGQSGEIDIHDNNVEGKGGIGITVYPGATVTGKTLSGNVIAMPEGPGIVYSGSDIPGDITGNTLTASKNNYIQISGTVSHSSTWNDGGTRVLFAEEVTVAAGATLHITPGVHLLNPAMTVNGTLLAEGTAEDPVRFTSATETGAGQWSPVVFKPGSGSSVLSHVEVANGGWRDSGYINCNKGALAVEGSSPTIAHSTIREACGYGITALSGGAPEIADDTFVKAGAAITYSASSGQSGEINIHDNYVEGGSSGIDVTVKPGASVNAKALRGNTVVGTEGVGVSYSGTDVPGDITENTLSANAGNYILVSGTVAHSSTWNDGGTKVLVGEGLTIAAGVTLSINPGVHLLDPVMTVEGTLLAEGTAETPVRFTGAEEKAAGEWRSIFFKPGSGASVLSHVEVANGGSRDAGYFTCNNGAITVEGSAPTIVDSTIRDACGSGIRVPSGGAPTIASDAFLNAGGVAITYSASSGQSGEINIHDNYVEGIGGIVITAYSGAAVTGKTLHGNVIATPEGPGIDYSGPDIPGDITENTLVASKKNYIQLAGTVGHSSTWNDGGAPVRFVEEVTVAAGATLRINPGVHVQNPIMTVNGTLLAEGTAEDPVRFTGTGEKAIGEWRSIFFKPGSGGSVLSHVEVANGGGRDAGYSNCNNGALTVEGSSPAIVHSTIREACGFGILVKSGSPKIEWNRFRATGIGVSYAGAGAISAPNNDWNCASGPQPAGCGVAISGNVNWKPAVQLPEPEGHCRGKESQCGEGADPVSLATGQLAYAHRDLLLTNKSALPLEFARSYSSGSGADTGLGPGWSQTGLASATELDSGEVFVLRQDGRQDLFLKTEAGYQAPSGVTDTLAKAEGTFQLTSLEGTVSRFDSSGRIASITDDHGLETTYSYDADGRLAAITDPSAQTLTFAYNASNHITSVKDSTGREAKFAYSAAGDLESATDALGGVTKYTYDSQHRLTQITDPRGNVILKNTYDSQGRITEQRDGLESLWKLEYNPGETVVTEPEGGKLKYGFDSQSRVISETDQLGHTTTIKYDAAGNISEETLPGGVPWNLNHDNSGNLILVKDPAGGERKYEYDAKNHLTRFTDPRGNSWGYEWSAAGDLTKVTDPAGGEATFTYNASGQPLTATDPAKHKTGFSWDARGNRTSVTDPLGHKTSFEYDSRNYLIAQTLPGLKAENFERDALGDLLARTTPEGHKTKYAYDANGLPTQVTDPAEGVWKIERNAMERPTVYTDPLGQQAKVSYNGNLKPVKVTNRRGKETTYAYDLANQLTEVARPEGEVWKYGYDSRGNRTSTLDPRGHETTYKYDLLDRMTEAAEPLSVTSKYAYNANGDLTSLTDPRGNTTSYAYDKLDRLTEINQPLEKKTSFSYDAAGNQLTKTTGLGTLEYGYDAANRLTSVKSGASTLRSYGYDAANRLTSATDAAAHKIELGRTEEGLVSSLSDGRGQSLTRSFDPRGLLTKQVDSRGTFEYGYDKLGRKTSLTDPQGKALGFAYDPEGDLTGITRPNGITTTNVYDNAGRLSETVAKGEAGSTFESLKYAYDAAGNVTNRIDQRLGSENTYAYDALGRLTEFNPPGEGSTTYGYDAAGNRTQAGPTTYTFNALNQLTGSSSGATYTYDGGGRLKTKTNASGKTTFGWDLLDHLASVEGPSGTVTYAFDGLERLSERKNGKTAEAIRVYHYGDRGDMPTYEANGEGKTTTSFVQSPGGLIEQRTGETTSFPIVDGHGDVTGVTGPSGEKKSRSGYDPWGQQILGPSQEMGYLGAWERVGDQTSGLIQMGARSYDPTLGAFASEDPVLGHLGYGISTNRYPYVWDNPANRFDLNGRDVCVFDACAGDAVETVGDMADETWQTGSYLITHPGDAATNAVNYWAESDSPASYVFGPLATVGDMALNPDRVGYYLDKVSPAQMAATGFAAAGTVGIGGLTIMATDACYGVAAPLEAVHTCTFIAGTGMAMTGAGVTATAGAASR